MSDITANEKILTFNLLVLVHLMADSDGSFLLQFHNKRIVSVQPVGKKQKADELINEQPTDHEKGLTV
jgi:hypothetical protein